jgi:hypothetical protein
MMRAGFETWPATPVLDKRSHQTRTRLAAQPETEELLPSTKREQPGSASHSLMKVSGAFKKSGFN